MAVKYKIMDQHVEHVDALWNDLSDMVHRGMITHSQCRAVTTHILPHLPRHVVIEMRTPKGVMRVTMGGDMPIAFTISPRAKRLEP